MSDTYNPSIVKVECLIFLHIFKAGGTAVTDVLHKYYGNKHHGVWNTLPGHPKHPLSLGDKLAFASGHGIFGLHEYVRPKSCKYITFLRDPAERLFSAFHNIREHPEHPWHRVLNKMTFAQMLETRDHAVWAQVDNHQVRELVGIGKEDRFIATPVDLERAKQNIQRMFIFVGKTEKINQQVGTLANQLGVRLDPVQRLNVTRVKPKSIPAELRARAYELNPLDLELIKGVEEGQCES